MWYLILERWNLEQWYFFFYAVRMLHALLSASVLTSWCFIVLCCFFLFCCFFGFDVFHSTSLFRDRFCLRFCSCNCNLFCDHYCCRSHSRTDIESLKCHNQMVSILLKKIKSIFTFDWLVVWYYFFFFNSILLPKTKTRSN